MLEIQKFIRNSENIQHANTFLEESLCLRITESKLFFPNGGFETVYIYNYHQWMTPFDSVVGKEARGLILNSDGAVVSLSFPRFPNYKQDPKADEAFHWESACLEEKLDGTLIVIFGYRGHFFIQTRGLIDASGEIAGTGVTYRDAVMGYLHKVTNGNPFKHFYGNMCYAFEYIGPGNRHVTPYDTTSLVLLSIFNRLTLAEMSKEFVDRYAAGTPFPRPITLDLMGLHDTVGENINYHMNNLDPLDEGYIVVDRNRNRLKIKSKSHVEVSNALNVGDGVRPVHFAGIVLRGEHGEMTTYFPEYRGVLDLLLETLEELRKECADLWEASKDIKLRKDFAAAVSECPLKHVLFNARDLQKARSPVESIFKTIEESVRPENLVKIMKERKEDRYEEVVKDILDINEK
jgi:hypothetical protein